MFYQILYFFLLPIFPQATDFQRVQLALSAPKGTMFYIGEDERYRIRHALIQTAYDMEILGANESVNWFRIAWGDEWEMLSFYLDLDWLKDRMHKAKDLPKLSEAARLPPDYVYDDAIEFNRTYKANIEKRLELELYQQDKLREIIDETNWCWEIWRAMRDAGRCHYSPLAQREALAKVKRLIGDEAWEECVFPPNVPLWRFEHQPFFFNRR